MAQLPAPTGVSVRYVGTAALGTSQFWYWIQAVYPDGLSFLSSLGTTGAKCPAAFSQNNFAQVQWNAMPGAIGYIVWRTTTSSPPTSGSQQLAILTAENGIKDDGSSWVIQSGTVRYDGLYVAKAYYNVPTDGGAAGTITPALSDFLPLGAIVLGGQVNSTTAFVGSGASLAVGFSGTIGGVAADVDAFLAATAITSLTADALLNTLFTFAAAAKVTVTGQITVTPSAATITAGVLEVFLLYVIATNA